MNLYSVSRNITVSSGLAKLTNLSTISIMCGNVVFQLTEHANIYINTAQYLKLLPLL